MNLLPDELLLRVFKYVPPHDRRISLRLVCRQWNKITQDRIFTQDEVIVAKTEFHKEVLSLFRTSRRSIFNLHFIRQQPSENFKFDYVFWKSCGEQVRSLVFDNCNLSFSLFAKIISRCPHVSHVSLIMDSPASRWLPNSPTSVDPISVGPAPSIPAPSVSSFALRLGLCRESLLLDIISTTLGSFPNLEQLKIDLSRDYLDVTRLSAIQYAFYSCYLNHNDKFRLLSNGKFISSIIAERIRVLNTKLKKLWLMQSNSGASMQPISWDISDVFSIMDNLEELTIDGLHNLVERIILGPDEILARMPNISTLNLSCIPARLEIDRVLGQILDSLPNLQILRLNFFSSFYYDATVLQKLLLSKLKRLYLRSHCTYGLQDSLVQPPGTRSAYSELPVNFTLEELVIFEHSPHRSEEKLFVRISPCLRNLRYLALNWLGDKALHAIFENQKFLKSLLLEGCEDCTHYGFTGDSGITILEEFSIKGLKDLEYLRITSMNVGLTKPTTPLSLLLPKLKRLEVYIQKNRDGLVPNVTFVNNLIKIITQLQNLEALELRLPTRISLKKVKRILGPLKCIRYFSLNFNCIDAEAGMTKPIIHQLFNMQPTLSYFEFNYKAFSRHEMRTESPQVQNPSSQLSDSKPTRIIPKWSNSGETDPVESTSFCNFRFDC